MTTTKPLARNDYADLVHNALPARMLANPIPIDPEAKYSRRQCIVDECPRISARRGHDLCEAHGRKFSRANVSDSVTWAVGQLVGDLHSDAKGTFGLYMVHDAPNELIRDELAYGLYCRGEKLRPVRPPTVNRLVRVLAGFQIQSLLEIRYDERRIDEIALAASAYVNQIHPFLYDTLDALCELLGDEPSRRRIGRSAAGGSAWVNLHLIRNPIFRETIKKWMDYRLNTETNSVSHIAQTVRWASEFVEWLEGRGIHKWEDLRRKDLIDYIAAMKVSVKVNGEPHSNRYRAKMLGAVNTFLEQCSANEWAALRPGLKIYRHEMPKPEEAVPRLIGKLAVARLRDPGNLQLVDDVDIRLIIRIMAETGLRRSDVAHGMDIDTLIDLGDDKWSMRYLNIKSKQVCVIPIKAEVAQAIAAHVTWKQAKYPGSRLLFGRSDTGKPLVLTSINKALNELVETLDLKGESGSDAHVTPHMFRHQRATDWLDEGLGLRAIQKLLGHRKLGTTEIYAHMSEKRVREEWEKSLAVNKDGDLLYSPGSVEMDAAWAHAFLGGATQALPNGRCGMPCSEECEHANACLWCPLFITTPEFLPVLRDERDQAEVMMQLAEEAGQQRIVERNKKPFIQLTKIIASLEAIVERDNPVTA